MIELVDWFLLNAWLRIVIVKNVNSYIYKLKRRRKKTEKINIVLSINKETLSNLTNQIIHKSKSYFNHVLINMYCVYFLCEESKFFNSKSINNKWNDTSRLYICVRSFTFFIWYPNRFFVFLHKLPYVVYSRSIFKRALIMPANMAELVSGSPYVKQLVI